MVEHGYIWSPHDSCVYNRRVKNGSFIYLLLYADDMFIASREMTDIQELKVLLNNEFDMKDLRATHKILGTEMHRDHEQRELFLS